MKTKLIIYGAGGLGREVLAMVDGDSRYEVKGFIDDSKVVGTTVANVQVVAHYDTLESFSDCSFVVAIGDPVTKSKIVGKLRAKHVKFATIIHPSAMIGSASVIIGEGSIVCAGVMLTTDIHIGDHVLLNLGCSVGHDARIASYTSIMPGANIAGEVTLGEKVLVGAGASIMNRVSVGERSKVGMGAVVLTNVPQDVTVVGVPAKPVVK